MSKMSQQVAMLSAIAMGLQTNNQYLPRREFYKEPIEYKKADAQKKKKRKATQKSKRMNRK